MYNCPACNTELDFQPWDGNIPSSEICHYCGIQFGYTDAAGGDEEKRSELYIKWKEAWIKNDKNP